MLRQETEAGYWLVTHPDHAHLAGAFAEHWGNDTFARPEPRAHVMKGISQHDDGWAARDAMPQITRQGKPSAFSVELVGKYSAFEEIDLKDYLAVRGRAVRMAAEEDAYAGLLISMHTYNLLGEHADRSTIAPDQLPLLDEFLVDQKAFQKELLQKIAADSSVPATAKSEEIIFDHFRLLQANDNLSLLSCVNFSAPSNLLHPLPLRSGGHSPIAVRAVADRRFVLDPYPFDEPSLTFQFPSRYVEGKLFSSAADLQKAFASAPVKMLSVTLSAA
jgi:hypothetical protein